MFCAADRSGEASVQSTVLFDRSDLYSSSEYSDRRGSVQFDVLYRVRCSDLSTPKYLESEQFSRNSWDVAIFTDLFRSVQLELQFDEWSYSSIGSHNFRTATVLKPSVQVTSMFCTARRSIQIGDNNLQHIEVYCTLRSKCSDEWPI